MQESFMLGPDFVMFIMFIMIIVVKLAERACCLQGSHKLWKSWKTWKITKKSSMHGKILELKKNNGKIVEFCEII